MSPERTVEASGETVSEAKWRALRELELAVPGLDKANVRFQVLSEGERGLLGVGYTPARVLAAVDSSLDGAPAAETPPIDESEAAASLRDLLAHITAAIGVRCRIEVDESGGVLAGTCYGDDIGLLIGRHGQTIDAVQVLAAAIAGGSGEDRLEVVIDAAGYRDRRRRTLEAVALRSAEEAVRTGSRVELEPMSSAERKLVHTALADREDVTTSSDGDEPNRFVVVEPTP
ncbi:MAG TPA: RNA-binding cell elongation regulator Jag/EloR [Gaiellaceae bacterium]|nr:RNA-binding cell elongation regulator Jag/EloR [Gaiellaceae bacterium]